MRRRPALNGLKAQMVNWGAEHCNCDLEVRRHVEGVPAVHVEDHVGGGTAKGGYQRGQSFPENEEMQV